MTPEPLIPRLVVITLACGHTVTLGIPPEVDPPPGYVLHCYECEADVAVESVVPDAEVEDPAVPSGADATTQAAHTPILHGGE